MGKIASNSNVVKGTNFFNEISGSPITLYVSFDIACRSKLFIASSKNSDCSVAGFTVFSTNFDGALPLLKPGILILLDKLVRTLPFILDSSDSSAAMEIIT